MGVFYEKSFLKTISWFPALLLSVCMIPIRAASADQAVEDPSAALDNSTVAQDTEIDTLDETTVSFDSQEAVSKVTGVKARTASTKKISHIVISQTNSIKLPKPAWLSSTTHSRSSSFI